jgi:hypothetical protein
MLILTVIGAAALFLGSLLLGEIYLPAGAVAAVLLINIALFVTGRGKVTRENTLLLLWFILLSHRSFIPRTSLSEAGPLFFVEVMATLAVFFGSLLVLALSVADLKVRIFESRFWFTGYVALAGVSLLWTPAPYYSGFWLIRLICVAMILLVYFSDADREGCRRFFLTTLLASIPVVALPIIGYVTGTSTSQMGSHRVSGYWVHPSVAGMAAFSVAVGSLTVLLQRDNRPFLLHFGMALLGLMSGFVAGGKTGAVGGAIAVSAMLLLGRRFRLWIGMLAAAVVGYAVYHLVLQHMDVGLAATLGSYDFERLGTIQARVELWLGILRAWAESPLTTFLGRGFASLRASPLPSPTGWAPGQAHSSYVNLLIDAGALGFILYFAMLFRPVAGAIGLAWREARDFTESPEFPVFIALLPLVVGGLVDDAFGGTLQPTSYLTIGMVMVLDRLLHLRQMVRGASLEASLAPVELVPRRIVAPPPRA